MCLKSLFAYIYLRGRPKTIICYENIVLNLTKHIYNQVFN